MKKHISHIILGFILISFSSFYSCNRELDEAPYLTYDGEATHTIAEFLAFHPIGSTDSYDSVPKGVVISGIVISSDEQGNCYKYINIQDETGGIQIKINNTTLYQKYKVGQKVFIKCDGLVLGDYRRLPQLGWWANGSMEPIANNKEGGYIFRHGLVASPPTPKVITKVADIANSDYNTLIKIENCSFANGGEVTYAEPNASTSRTITLAEGGTIELRTSNYATFAGNLLPKGNGNLVGILTRYNTTLQLTIRSLDDVQEFQNEETIHNVDLSVDLFANGWSNQRQAGIIDWEYVNGLERMSITGNAGEANDCWLLSPSFNFSNYRNVKMEFNHRVPGDLGSNEHMKVYYSTSASGSGFNETEWTEIPFNTFFSSFGNTAISIPDAAISSSNFRIAFRYIDDRGANWTLASIAFKSLINN